MIEDVIAIAVIAELLAQFLDSLFHLLGYRLAAWHRHDDGTVKRPGILSRSAPGRGLDDSAAEHPIAPVDRRGLARRHGRLSRLETQDAFVPQGRHRCPVGAVLHFDRFPVHHRKVDPGDFRQADRTDRQFGSISQDDR